MKKRMICMLLACLLVLGLFAGCGNKQLEKTEEAESTEIVQEEPAQTVEQDMNADSQTQAPKPAPVSESQSQAEESNTESETAGEPEPQPQQNPRDIAGGMMGSSVESLYEAIGNPDSSSYASSCNGPGEDGELYYDGFTVYTYRENGNEIIVDVW